MAVSVILNAVQANNAATLKQNILNVFRDMSPCCVVYSPSFVVKLVGPLHLEFFASLEHLPYIVFHGTTKTNH